MKLLENFLKSELGVKPKEFVNRFIKFEEKIFLWNKKVNLISRKSESIEPHILNSIFFLTKYGLLGSEKIFDIGTGGGFPGIPLKILYPNLIMVLNDSVNKKVRAVDDMRISLGLKYVECICERAEVLSEQKKFKKKFDIVISKAVTDLVEIYTWGKKLLNTNGQMISIKGGNIDEEIATFKKKYPKKSLSVTEFEFDPVYNIEDKKIVIIK